MFDESHLPARAGLLLLGAAAIGGCRPAPEADQLQPIAVHTFEACAPGPQATLDLKALGDFSVDNSSAESLPLTSGERVLRLPLTTLALEGVARDGSGEWQGVGPVRGARADISLWPTNQACELARHDGFPLQSSSLGVNPQRNEVLVVGGEEAGPNAARALLLRLDTTEIREVPGGILPARADAKLSPFGDGMLLSGGIDPRERGDERFDLATPLASAIVYDAESGRFELNQEIAISPRASHAAVELITGETLLVGGRSPQSPALASIEAVSPETRSARIAGLTQLVQRRANPSVFVLEDGRVFVGAGVDASKQPVQTVEYLSPDASQHLGSTPLRASEFARFAPLPGSTVLGVGVCPVDAPTCDPLRGAVWLAGERVFPLPPLPVDLQDPQLLPAARGEPWLITGSGQERVSYRFFPWESRFVANPDPPSALPPQAALAVDPGAFVWAEAGRVLGVRSDVRQALARDIGPQLLTQPTLETGVVPTSPPNLDDPEAPLSFTAAGLGLRSFGSVWISDASFAGFDLEITRAAGAPPRVFLQGVSHRCTADACGGSRLLGAGDCAWPSVATESRVLKVVRQGAQIRLTASDEETLCELSGLGDRVRIGIAAAGDGVTTLRSLEVVRAP
ncbi:MAG: hypothetical protein KC766_32945 [Myxococcales bacterium]|nr:hypothetical protein [Myxococcales bacterium]